MTPETSPRAGVRSLLGLAVLAVVVAGATRCFAASPAVTTEPLPSEKDRWIELRSEQLTFFSSAPERVPRKLATRVERLRQVLAQLGGKADVRAPRPLELFLFKDQRSYRPFRLVGRDGKPEDWGAYYLPRADRDTIVLYDWDGGDPISQALATYLYSLIGATFERIPNWANNGLASLYSTFTVKEESAADIGRPISHYVQLLDRQPRFATRQILALGRAEEERLDLSRRDVFRAQAWLTTHYLLLGRADRRGDFSRFLAAVEAGADPLQAFPESFGITPEALDEQLEIVLRKRVFPFVAYRFADLPPIAEFRLREVGYSEILARLGDLTRRLGPGERPRGVAMLEAARRRDPASPWPPLGLALARLDEGDDAATEALLREALALAPELEPAQAALGSLLMNRSSGREPDAARAAEARELLGRATAVEPSRLESWIALGRAELAAGGDAKRAVRAFETAHRLAPGRADLVGWVAHALGEDGQHQRAEAVVRSTLLASPNPEDRISGNSYLKQIAEREVWGLANAGKSDEALARIEAYLAAGADAELQKSLNATKARIQSQVAGQRCYDDYNAGIRAANAQKFAEARPLFEKVVADCAATDAALVTRARETLEEITKFEKKRKG